MKSIVTGKLNFVLCIVLIRACRGQHLKGKQKLNSDDLSLKEAVVVSYFLHILLSKAFSYCKNAKLNVTIALNLVNIMKLLF